MAGKKNEHNRLATKLEGVRMYLEEGKSHREMTELLGIRDPDRIEK